MSNRSYRFIVSGRVQGVFFRQSCAEAARAHQLSGWVRNLTDGRVEGLAHGAEFSLRQLRDWLHHGPPAARVDAVEWIESAEIPDAGFSVRR
ncbi:MAG TPA: acylphosphatase [Nevskiaceae bacterium]|nr:acylphosphatase [Nevskiaceae bacterium]